MTWSMLVLACAANAVPFWIKDAQVLHHQVLQADITFGIGGSESGGELFVTRKGITGFRRVEFPSENGRAIRLIWDKSFKYSLRQTRVASC